MSYLPCDTCPGQVIPGQFSPIRVPLQDDEGFPVLTNGRVTMQTFRLPHHRARFVSMSADPETTLPNGEVRPSRWGAQEEAEHSVFDPTGLAPAACDHGLPEHPAGYPLRNGGRSWMRAKYIDVSKSGIRCPVCRGEPRPEDLTAARA